MRECAGLPGPLANNLLLLGLPGIFVGPCGRAVCRRRSKRADCPRAAFTPPLRRRAVLVSAMPQMLIKCPVNSLGNLVGKRWPIVRLTSQMGGSALWLPFSRSANAKGVVDTNGGAAGCNWQSRRWVCEKFMTGR